MHDLGSIQVYMDSGQCSKLIIILINRNISISEFSISDTSISRNELLAQNNRNISKSIIIVVKGSKQKNLNRI